MKNYNWKQLHEDLEADNVIGHYGADNVPYHALTEAKHGIDLHKCHKIKSKDERPIEKLEKLLSHPKTKESWDTILSMDPMGLYSSRPTNSLFMLD